MKSIISWVVAGCLWAALSAPAAYVELADGSRRDGSAIRARSDGAVILTTPQGNVEFTRGQYTKAVADKPAEFDQARQLAAQKKFDEAIKLLDPIITNLRFLEWDNNARALKAQVLAAKGDAAGAVTVYEQLFTAAPDRKKDSAVLWAYYEAMVGAKQFDKLGPQLDDLINKGSRPDAAKAQIVRGDIKLSQANLEGAALDYLRSAILFESEKETLPEALFKAADALEKLRDPRAKELYRRVASEFGGTPWAQKAAGK